MERRPNNRNKFRTIKKAFNWVLALVIVGAIVGGIYLFMNSASVSRGWKSIKSNYTGGINRTVSVYDMKGDKIAEYSGKFDIKESENKVMLIS